MQQRNLLDFSSKNYSGACAYMLCSNLITPTHHSTFQDGTSGTRSMNNQRCTGNEASILKKIGENPFGNDQ
jgi:hypothetical protein